MLSHERRQLGHDFGFAPALIERHIPEPEREGSLKMVRHVNVVTTYLSWMAVGEPRHFEGSLYAAAIAAMDCVTDYRNERIGGGVTRRALHGGTEYPELELVETASDVARSPEFDDGMEKIAQWQDESLSQFEDPSATDLMLVTEMKGGWSARTHLHALKAEPTYDEVEFMLEFGAVMQLLDDYLDQPDDEDAGISTLFTEGYTTRQDLAFRREEMMDEAEALWGASPATRRLRRILRLHTRLGDVANRTPLRPEWLVPYYL
jgi:hypothetical protein